MGRRSIITAIFAIILALTALGPGASAGWLSYEVPNLLVAVSVEATAGAGASAEWTGVATDMLSQ